jgi:hypothetical protein
MEGIIKTAQEELGCFNWLHQTQEMESDGRSFEHGHDPVFFGGYQLTIYRFPKKYSGPWGLLFSLPAM